MHHRQNEQPVGAGGDFNPVIRNRVIPCPDWVHANNTGTPFLKPTNTHFDWIAVMVFGHTKQHEKFGVIPVGLAKFPKTATDRIDAGCRHIDRTKATMGSIIGRAIRLRPKAGEALRLVAPGEKGQFFWCGGTQWGQPIHGYLQRLIPTDFLKLP